MENFEFSSARVSEKPGFMKKPPNKGLKAVVLAMLGFPTYPWRERGDEAGVFQTQSIGKAGYANQRES